MGGATAAVTKDPKAEGAEGEQVEKPEEGEGAAAAAATTTTDDKTGAADAADDEGLEVIEEGANAGTDGRGKTVVPLKTHIRQKQKWQGKVKNAEGNAAAKEQENELLRLQLQQRDEELAKLRATQKGPPKRSDFESDEAFEQAREKHSRAQTEALVVDVLKKHAPATTAKAEDDPENDPEIQAHYERAEKLRAPDFNEREDKVIEAIGLQAARQIIKQYPNSEALIYALGGNPDKLEEIAAGLKKDPVRAVINLTQYAAKLKLEPRKKAPPPDSGDDKKPTVGVNDAQKQLDALRAKRDRGEATTDDVLKFKKECRKKGIAVE